MTAIHPDDVEMWNQHPTADDLRQQQQILCNTIASGEANESACYRAIERLTKRIAEMEGK